MACTRTLKIALGALLLLAGLLVFDLTSHARERGYTTVAGDGQKRTVRSRSLKNQQKIIRYRGDRRTLHGSLFILDGNELIRESRREQAARYRSHLRNKVSVMRTRAGAKIIKVSEKMKRLGEERAAKREAKMMAEFDNLDIRYYRNNEAYDARFPSIVYLELLNK
ncbi:MAG: hypothetical protein HRU27_18620 [Rhizobiaceae bacterium]|nr:hypothetical protein [Hyphomicrobiales bacterium]NRB32610.1 hypothetical protein [Rhizobiaceae bacterium]